MRPQIAIILGFVFAMSPYILWSFDGPNQYYYYQITYYPFFIWCIALLSFLFGSYEFNRGKQVRSVDFKVKQYSENNIGRLILLLILAQCLLLIKSTQELGYLPILQFASGVNISEVNDDLQQSSFGLYGLIVIICIFLTNYSCILMYAKRRLSFKLKVILILSAAVAIISSVFLGKRQLLMIVVMIVFVHFHFKYALNKINKIKLTTYMFLIAIGLISTVGIISDLRNNLSNNDSNYFSTGALEIINYLSFPLINFESQFSISSFVGEFRQFSPVVSQLIPYKLLDSASFFIQEAPAPEPTIGSGTVGILHWNLGLFSIPVIYFLYGKIASKWYRLAITNPECRTPYGLMLWSIISSHTYIHIFSLVFLWAPALIILFLNNKLNLLNDRSSFG